ncbi:WAT1-related protein-like isoform X2 [Iris pallida]|uniref:WAT1-related protein n=1 Tax=Iris pallida TaxID=29817 RepID=A0AAX6HE69_IRIPA|nr:WAT1-related protein-like isoform X2 [Iris pallida]
MRSLEEVVPCFGMITVQLAYGGANILCKLALARGLSYLVFTVYRHLLAMAILGPLAYVLERKRRPALSLSILAKIFMLALFGTTIHQNVYYAGLSYTSPTVASALGSVIPALTFILALMLKLEKVTIGSAKGWAKIIGAVVCISGALLFTFWKGHLLGGLVKHPLILVGTKGSGQGPQRGKDDWIKGSLLILTSNIAFSAWLILQAMIYEVYPARLSMTALICFFASLQSSVLGLIFERCKSSWRMGWNIQMLTIVYCGTVISCLVYYLQTFCISKKGPVFAAMFSPLILIIVGAFSAFFLAERLYMGSLIGAVLIILGLYGVLWGKSKDFDENGETKMIAEKTTQTLDAKNCISSSDCHNV